MFLDPADYTTLHYTCPVRRGRHPQPAVKSTALATPSSSTTPLTLQNERENPEGIVERDGVGLSAFRSAVQLKQLRQLPA